jgi:hypothetical protein
MYNPFHESVRPPDDCHTSRLKHAAVNITNTVSDIHRVLLLSPGNQRRRYKVPYMNTSSIYIYLFITKIVVYKF